MSLPFFLPSLFFTLSLIYIHCTMHVSLPFLREFSKARETRPLGCRTAPPLLQVSPPIPSFTVFLSHFVTLLPDLSHFLFFSLSCLRYPSVSPPFFVIFITQHSPFLPFCLAALIALGTTVSYLQLVSFATLFCFHRYHP